MFFSKNKSDVIQVCEPLKFSSLTTDPCLLKQYPFLKECTKYLMVQNEYVVHRMLRTYQFCALKEHVVEFVNPITGEKCISEQSFFVDDVIFYFVNCKNSFFVASAHIGAGYPLSAIFFPEKNQLLKFDNPIWGVTTNHVEELKKIFILETLKCKRFDETGIVVGHDNFAHHLANELSPLLFFLKTNTQIKKPRLFVKCEPILPLDVIFSDYGIGSAVYLDKKERSEINSKNIFLTHVGGQYVSVEMRKLVCDKCIKAATEFLKKTRLVLSNKWPVFWLSVRTKDRIMINQKEALMAVILKLKSFYKNCFFVLDGFSFPSDFFENRSRYTDQCNRLFPKVALEDNNIIEDIISSLNISTDSIINASRLAVSDSIALASYADFYLTSHGTVQHKIGWIGNTPGIIHSNSSLVSDEAAIWTSNYVEGGLIPEVVPLKMIYDESPSSYSSQAKKTFRGDYSIVDVGCFAEYVLLEVKKALDEIYPKKLESIHCS